MTASHYPQDGVYVRGLFLEGAKWCKTEQALAESDPKVLFSFAPVLLFRPVKKTEMSTNPSYSCPVYKTRYTFDVRTAHERGDD
jgi:dynein heavy chain